jgi:hypothetical protein
MKSKAAAAGMGDTKHEVAECEMMQRSSQTPRVWRRSGCEHMNFTSRKVARTVETWMTGSRQNESWRRSIRQSKGALLWTGPLGLDVYAGEACLIDFECGVDRENWRNRCLKRSLS